MAALLTLAAAPPAPAQQTREQAKPPRIAYLFPAGARTGDTVRIAVGGQQLGEVLDACISGEGVSVKVIEYVWTLNPRQRAGLAETLAALERARPTIEILDAIADMRREIATLRPASPSLADTVIVEAVVGPDAAPGPRGLRLLTRGGLSNPLVFSVGEAPESNEGTLPEVPLEDQLLRTVGVPVPLPEPKISGPIPVTLPAVVNGQILPGSTDRYRFEARKGQTIVAVVEARSLIPYIADGVPGWFQAAVSVHDAKGRELAYADHFRFQADPVLCVVIPEDGAYVAEIHDSIYRGREDFVYRMSIGEFPYVTDVFPLGCQAGSQAKLEVKGWNLPSGRTVLDARALPPGVSRLPPLANGPDGNLVPFDVGDDPEVTESRSHETPADAQKLTPPVIVNGRIGRPGQWDVYRFQAHAGDAIVAQVRARRLGSPLDSVLMLTDAAGATVAVSDDSGDNRDAGLETHHADSYIRAVIATGGTYYLHLGDVQQQGGPEYAYRLRLGPPRPDYELRIAPSAINLTPGENVPVTVYALRKDGFAGDIALFLTNAPAGLVLSGGRIGATQDSARLTLAALPAAARGHTPLSLKGRATVAGREVVREALPVEDMMQAFLWRHLVPAPDLSADVLAGSPPRWPITLSGKLPVAIPAGTSVVVQVDMGKTGMAAEGPIQFELVDPPDGITVQPADSAGGPARLVLACDAAKIKPGFKGNLIAVAYAMVPPRHQGQGKAFRPRFDLAETMQAFKEAPSFPDKEPIQFVRNNPNHERTAFDFDASMQPAEKQAAPAREPEPPPGGPPPPQKLMLGLLPAIVFEIVNP